MRSFRSIFVAAGVVSLSAAGALAQPTGMNFLVNTDGGSNWNWQTAGSPGDWTQDATNPQQWSISGNVVRPTFAIDFGLTLDPDPFVSQSFNITNNTAVTQTYTISVSLPVLPPFPGPTSTLGSISGALVDGNGDGASLVTSTGPGSSIYTALIDGAPYQQLILDPFSISAPPQLTTPIGPASFSFPSGQPGTLVSIGITNTFTLSPGDSVSFLSTFFIGPEIPAPGAAGAFALAGLAAARRRRR